MKSVMTPLGWSAIALVFVACGEGEATCDLAVACYEECCVDSENEERMSECCGVADLLFTDAVATDLYACILEASCDTLAASPVGVRTECLLGIVDTFTPSDTHLELADAHCRHDQDLCEG